MQPGVVLFLRVCSVAAFLLFCVLLNDCNDDNTSRHHAAATSRASLLLPTATHAANICHTANIAAAAPTAEYVLFSAFAVYVCSAAFDASPFAVNIHITHRPDMLPCVYVVCIFVLHFFDMCCEY